VPNIFVNVGRDPTNRPSHVAASRNAPGSRTETAGDSERVVEKEWFAMATPCAQDASWAETLLPVVNV
jgi:hypothetical protein